MGAIKPAWFLVCEKSQYFGSVDEFYQYFMANPLITDAFDLWYDEYVILQMQYTDLFNMIPTDFSGFTQMMPPVGSQSI